MASKRSTRASWPDDHERVSSLFDKRDDAAIRRRVLLTAAVVLIVLTGAFAAFQAGARKSSRALQGLKSFENNNVESLHLLNNISGASDTNAFPAGSSHSTATSSVSTADTQSQNETPIKSTLDGQLTAAADTISAKSQVATGNASSNPSSASGKITSGLQSAASNITATIASKVSGALAKGQSAANTQNAAKAQTTAKAQSAAKGQTAAKLKAANAAASRLGAAGPATFPWDVKMTEQMVCDDTCHKAKDGKCDDGSGGEEEQVFCDLGTDCSDCGAWTFKQTLANRTLPIRSLHDRQIDVIVKNTSSVPAFRMAYTDPSKDIDVSGQMEFGGVVEIGLTMMWYKALKDKCIRRDGSRGLVLDVGGNFGWYSIYAATLGCRVISWEPVPHFRAFLEYNRQLNHLEDLIDIRDTAVAEVSGVTYNLTVPHKGIWGTAGIGGLNVDRAIISEDDMEVVRAVGERVDEVVQEDVVLLKVDVEGHEPGVIQSATGLLDGYRWTPGFFLRAPPPPSPHSIVD